MSAKSRSRQYPDRPIVGVAAVIFKGNRILMVKRAQEPHPGGWALPGGLVKVGEPLEEAILREVKEECNIDIRVTKLVDVLDYIRHDSAKEVEYHYVLVDFEAEYTGGELKPDNHEILEARWCEGADLIHMSLPGLTASFLRTHYPVVFS